MKPCTHVGMSVTFDPPLAMASLRGQGKEAERDRLNSVWELRFSARESKVEILQEGQWLGVGFHRSDSAELCCTPYVWSCLLFEAGGIVITDGEGRCLCVGPQHYPVLRHCAEDALEGFTMSLRRLPIIDVRGMTAENTPQCPEALQSAARILGFFYLRVSEAIPLELLECVRRQCPETEHLVKITLQTSTGRVKVRSNPFKDQPVETPFWINSGARERYYAHATKVAEGLLVPWLIPSSSCTGASPLEMESPPETARPPALYHLLRAIVYPPEQQLEEHSDKTYVTLLTATSMSGLEIHDFNGQWVPLAESLCPEEECYLVNIGDALQMATHGEYVSRVHRARYVADGSARRVSLPLFVEPTAWPEPYVVQNVCVMELGN